MTVTVNGQPTEIPDGGTVADALRAAGLGQAPCATEVNAALVRRGDRETLTLRAGDRVEVVTLVGGG